MSNLDIILVSITGCMVFWMVVEIIAEIKWAIAYKRKRKEFAKQAEVVEKEMLTRRIDLLSGELQSFILHSNRKFAQFDLQLQKKAKK